VDKERVSQRLARDVEEAARGVPRWPALVAIFTASVLYYLLAEPYTLGPSWIVPLLVITLLISLLISRLSQLQRLTNLLVMLIIGSMTLSLATSALLFLYELTDKQIEPETLLRNAVQMWLANVINFAIWYWAIDGGGPSRRHPGRHSSTDFAFPQQQLDDDGLVEGWSPGFIDYLFLAFNHSTAFSPTDTLILSRRAKLLVMCQAAISLVIVAGVAAGAINRLGG
jgi:hypothetical protein